MIETARLLLRPLGPADRDAYAALVASPAGRRYLGGPRSAVDADAALAEAIRCQAEHGLSRWGVERRSDGRLIGICGLVRYAREGTPILGEIEIGWQMAEDVWGQGYAREAAEASLAWGWANLAVARIVAITVPANLASLALLARLRMRARPDLDFDHPLYAPGDPLRAHVTYEALKP